MLRFAFGLLVGLFVAASSYAATVGTIYDNFGPGSAHAVDSGRTVLGSFYPTQQILAVRFQSDRMWQVTKVDVAGEYTAGTNSAVLSLATDSAGSPGAIISTIGTVSFPGGSGDASGSYQSTTAPAGLNITSGTPYWIVMTPAQSTTDLCWDQTIASLPGDSYKYNFLDGNGWQPASNVTASLRILGIEVPEPGSGLCLAIAGMLQLARRRRRAGWNATLSFRRSDA